mmetsp:Transcript_16760/g.46055  ORF Transcript_16760/g.46055 Transcript_16760/m.46055 type:complete len:241 (+) Transcript_16760:461-1183(+)
MLMVLLLLSRAATALNIDKEIRYAGFGHFAFRQVILDANVSRQILKGKGINHARLNRLLQILSATLVQPLRQRVRIAFDGGETQHGIGTVGIGRFAFERTAKDGDIGGRDFVAQRKCLARVGHKENFSIHSVQMHLAKHGRNVRGHNLFHILKLEKLVAAVARPVNQNIGVLVGFQHGLVAVLVAVFVSGQDLDQFLGRHVVSTVVNFHAVALVQVLLVLLRQLVGSWIARIHGVLVGQQ